MKHKFKGIVPLAFLCLFLSAPSFAQQDTQKNIVDIASHDKNLSTLVTAIKAADLVDTLKGSGPFTVFAPTNAAFDKLPPGTLDKLLHDKKQLTDILTYHVISGEVMSKDIKNSSPATVEGQTIEINKTDKGVTVNNANVTQADIKASNGVIHEIDTVLMPPAKN
jgi:uncharacterized surface protein with fasciclin (FAS1) repeats